MVTTEELLKWHEEAKQMRAECDDYGVKYRRGLLSAEAYEKKLQESTEFFKAMRKRLG